MNELPLNEGVNQQVRSDYMTSDFTAPTTTQPSSPGGESTTTISPTVASRDQSLLLTSAASDEKNISAPLSTPPLTHPTTPPPVVTNSSVIDESIAVLPASDSISTAVTSSSSSSIPNTLSTHSIVVDSTTESLEPTPTTTLPTTSVADRQLAAYTDAALNARNRGRFRSSVGRRQLKPTNQLDPKLQAMLDAYAREQEEAALHATDRRLHSHSGLQSTHKQVIVDGRITYQPKSDFERLQYQLSQHVGEATSTDAVESASEPNQTSDASFQHLLDATALDSNRPSTTAATAFSDSSVESVVAADMPAEKISLASPSSSATDTSIGDSSTCDFRVFIHLDVTTDGEVHLEPVFINQRDLENLFNEHSIPAETLESSTTDDEMNLVDLMSADDHLEMKGEGRVHSLDEYRREREATEAARLAAATKPPPPSLLVLVDTYLSQNFKANPIAFLCYLGQFDFPPEAVLQWMMLIPKIAEKKSEQLALAAAQKAESEKSHLHRLSTASTVGRFQRSTASSAIRASSHAVLPANVVTMDQYDVDLRASGLPQDYIPKGLNDMLVMSRRYGKEPVLTLLTQLGHPPDEVQIIDCYLSVMMQLMDEQQQATMNAAGSIQSPAKSSSHATPSTSSISGGIIKRPTSAYTPPRSNIATLSSMRESNTGSLSMHQPSINSPAPPQPHLWKTSSGHSLIASTAPASTSSLTPTSASTSSSTSAVSGVSDSSTSMVTDTPTPTRQPHPNPQSLIPLDSTQPQTKIQFILLTQPSQPLIGIFHLTHTLHDVIQFVSGASGLSANQFDLTLLRPKQNLTSSDTNLTRTIAQLQLQNAKIHQVNKVTP